MENVIYKTAKELLLRAATGLPKDVEKAIAAARRNEKSPIAKIQLDAILQNVKIARKEKIPICQDTGIPVFYVSVGDASNAKANEIRSALRMAVGDATREIPLRPNVVHPLTRKNTGTNTGLGFPQIEFNFTYSKAVEITAKPVGCGCETFSKIEMLNPTAGEKEIVEKIVEFAQNAGGKPCPPYILGICIGGTADAAMKEAKMQSMRKVGSRKQGAQTTPEASADASALEKKILQAINSTGIGAMGLGGSTTALAVHTGILGTHTGMLPLAINTCCWACRRASARIEGGKVEHL